MLTDEKYQAVATRLQGAELNNLKLWYELFTSEPTSAHFFATLNALPEETRHRIIGQLADYSPEKYSCPIPQLLLSGCIVKVAKEMRPTARLEQDVAYFLNYVSPQCIINAAIQSMHYLFIFDDDAKHNLQFIINAIYKLKELGKLELIKEMFKQTYNAHGQDHSWLSATCHYCPSMYRAMITAMSETLGIKAVVDDILRHSLMFRFLEEQNPQNLIDTLLIVAAGCRNAKEHSLESPELDSAIVAFIAGRADGARPLLICFRECPQHFQVFTPLLYSLSARVIETIFTTPVGKGKTEKSLLMAMALIVASNEYARKKTKDKKKIARLKRRCSQQREILSLLISHIAKIEPTVRLTLLRDKYSGKRVSAHIKRCKQDPLFLNLREAKRKAKVELAHSDKPVYIAEMIHRLNRFYEPSRLRRITEHSKLKVYDCLVKTLKESETNTPEDAVKELFVAFYANFDENSHNTNVLFTIAYEYNVKVSAILPEAKEQASIHRAEHAAEVGKLETKKLLAH